MIERKIYFYRVHIGLDAAKKPLPFDPVKMLNHLASLAWNTSGRYWIDDEGKITCCWVDGLSSPHRMRLGTIRRSALPAIEKAGQLEPLDLPQDTGLAEQTHIVFFDDNIVGVEYNFYGPKISKLPYYLAERAVGVAPQMISFLPLLRQDVLDQLDNIGAIRRFTLKIRPAYAASIKDVDGNLFKALELMGDAGGAEEIEVTIGPKSYSRKFLPDGFKGTVIKLLQHPSFRHEALVARIQAENEDTKEIELLDLLNDKLVANREVVLEDEFHRLVKSESAYNVIESAFEELKEELLVAAGIEA